jgi:hypothetical protein
MRNSIFPIRAGRVSVLALAVALGACADRGDPVSAPPMAPQDPALLAVVTCTADVRAGKVACGQASMPQGVRGFIIVGNQGSYVQLTSANTAYNAVSHAFTTDVTVQNLIPQPIGTANGTTPDAQGVRVIFHSGPSVTSGTGGAAVGNADGTGAFTGANQPFFSYSGALLGGDGVLSSNETSGAKSWSLTVDPTVLTFTFQVYVVAEVPFPNGYVDVTPPADTVLAGGSLSLAATVRTATGNSLSGQAVTWSTPDSAIATVDAAGHLTALSPGTATITATAGGRSGTAAVAVCPNLAVGGVYVAASATTCIGTGAAAAEYTVVPVNLTAANSAFSVTGAGIVPVAGPPSPNRLPGGQLGGLRVPDGPVPDEAFHAEMLGRRLAVTGSLRDALVRNGGARRNIVPGVPSVGTVMNLNVGQGFCTPTDIRASTVKAVGTHVIVMEDNSNPAGGFTTAQYDSIASAFDSLAYPAVAGNFGTPFDIDANGRMIALYTASVNDLTPAGSGSYVGGFFYSRDLFGTASCAGSNQGEMFYMLAPDPAGSHGNVRSAAFVRSVTIGTLGHEFQHLINASRRLYGAGGPFPLEQVWLNEGMSHVAEEEVYYAATGHIPGENIDLAKVTASQAQIDRFFEFEEPNFGRLRQWLLRPDTAGPFRNADNLAIRGASWSFLRYAVDRKGTPESAFWSSLAFSPDTGFTNLANRLGTDPRPWFRDWAVAMYADDAVPGVAAQHRQPSWNFRSIYGPGGLSYGGGAAVYPLGKRDAANGVAQAFTVAGGGGAGYVRMGVAASAFAGLSNTVPGPGLAVVVIRTK